MIYFLQPIGGGRIKIGTTIQLSYRLKQLASEFGDDLEVLAIIDGDRPEERQLHRKFAHLRTVGEWFEPGDDLLGFIRSEGKPWDGTDPRNQYRIIKIDKATADMAAFVAHCRRQSLQEYLTDLCRETIQGEWNKEVLKEARRMKGEEP